MHSWGYMGRERVLVAGNQPCLAVLAAQWNPSVSPFIPTFEIEPDPDDVMTSHHFLHDNLSSTSTVSPLENISLLPVLLLLLCFSKLSFPYSEEVIWLFACTKFWNINYILSLLWILQRILISLREKPMSYSGLRCNLLSPLLWSSLASSLLLNKSLSSEVDIFLFLHVFISQFCIAVSTAVSHTSRGPQNMVSTVNSNAGLYNAGSLCSSLHSVDYPRVLPSHMSLQIPSSA